MERNIPKRNTPELAGKLDPADLAVSSDNNRRCKTCACFFLAVHPQNSKQTQGLCRRHGPNVVQLQVNGIAGPRIETQLVYAQTMPDLVCFDGWRPATVPPGDGFPVTVD